MVFNSDKHTFELFLEAVNVQSPSDELLDTAADDRDSNDDMPGESIIQTIVFLS